MDVDVDEEEECAGVSGRGTDSGRRCSCKCEWGFGLLTSRSVVFGGGTPLPFSNNGSLARLTVDETVADDATELSDVRGAEVVLDHCVVPPVPVVSSLAPLPRLPEETLGLLGGCNCSFSPPFILPAPPAPCLSSKCPRSLSFLGVIGFTNPNPLNAPLKSSASNTPRIAISQSRR